MKKKLKSVMCVLPHYNPIIKKKWIILDAFVFNNGEK